MDQPILLTKLKLLGAFFMGKQESKRPSAPVIQSVNLSDRAAVARLIKSTTQAPLKIKVVAPVKK